MKIYGLYVLQSLVVVFTSVRSFPDGRQSYSKCGYESCNPVKDDMINVHIIANTHDDVGWTKTYSEYYNQDVRQIISSVVKSLTEDPTGGHRKFIYVEMAFMKLWWGEQNLEMKSTVRELVNNGCLEFVLGGCLEFVLMVYE
ncbi:Lysosomal alpha-mannosidase [Mactra antiquata]